MHAGHAPCAFGFMMSSVPMTAPAYLSPLAPNKLPSNAVGVKRLNAPRVRALVEAASMIAAAAMRTIVVGLARPAVARRRMCLLLRLKPARADTCELSFACELVLELA